MKNYLFDSLGNYESDEVQEDGKQVLLKSVQDAWDEWHGAQNYFENVSDPELVDYAIYKIEAARRKYVYLLKQARREGVENNQFTL